MAYSQEVDVAQHGRKLVQFVAPDGASGLRAELVSGGQLVASKDVRFRRLDASGFLVGVLSEDGIVPSGLAAVRRGGGQVSAARLTPADLPADAVALEALDAIVVRNAAGDRLGAGQRSALRAWVKHGGQLIVAGGPGWRRSVEGIADMLPVSGLASREMAHLGALGAYAGSEPAREAALVAGGTPSDDARVLLAQDGIPLIVERTLGSGRVTFVAADPGLPPFRAWPHAESLWQRILVGGRATLPTFGDDDSGWGGTTMRGLLAQLMDVGLPGAGWLALFVLAYVALVGPGQYVVLRRIDRRDWAWVGFPALAVACTLGVYGLGTWARGPDMRVAAFSMVGIPLDATSAPIDTHLGLVAPSRRAYDLTFEDGASIRALPGRGGLAGEEAVIQVGRAGQPTRLPDLRLEAATLQAFRTRAFGEVSAPIEAELRVVGGRLEGTVRNLGGGTVEDAIVLAVGDLPSGESRMVSLPIPGLQTAGTMGRNSLPWIGTAGSSLVDARRDVLERLLRSDQGRHGDADGAATLLGWVAAELPALSVDGARATGGAMRLLAQALRIDYEASAIAIPPGLLRRLVLEGTATSRSVPSFAARGPMVFQFEVPPGVELGRVDRLRVHAQVEGSSRVGTGAATAAFGGPAGASPARVSLYRWADRSWVELAPDSSGVADAPAGAAFIDAGAIRLRLEPQGAEVVVHQLDVSIEGARR